MDSIRLGGEGTRPEGVTLDMNTAVEELHKLSAQEMKKALRDSHCLSFRPNSGKGAPVNVDIERVASLLPLHLLGCVASGISQPRFRHLLHGVRVLHTLSVLAARLPKLEQILLQEVKLREQVIELVIFTLIILAGVERDGRWGSFLAVLHSSLVAGCFYLLTAFITPEWRDVAPVLLAHPKVDVFMDAAFDAVRKDIVLLQGRFKALSAKLAKEKTPLLCGAEEVSASTLEQCEASIQVLQSLCESQAFRDRLLNHEELARKGGIISLVLVVLQLQLPSHLQHLPTLSASISRLKAKMLAMLLKFCEAEKFSFLDDVAKDARSKELATLVAKEIVALVKSAFFGTFSVQMVEEEEKRPTGTLYLNALRLADILSDDTNFRNLLMDSIAPDLATVLAMDPSEFSSKWCSGVSAQDMADCEIDATLVYDPFIGSNSAAMMSFPTSSSSEQGQRTCQLALKPVEPTSYAQELSALLVKLLANFHCYNPPVCPASEKERFLRLFMRCLKMGPLCPTNASFFMTSDQTAVRVCENLHILVDHVASLPTELANDEDILLSSVFAAELHEAFCLTSAESRSQAALVTFVRDAHEQRLKAIVARRENSERWQRTQRELEPIVPECDTQTMAVQQEAVSQVPEEASSAVDSKAEDPDMTAPARPQEYEAKVTNEEECASLPDTTDLRTNKRGTDVHPSGQHDERQEPTAVAAAPVQAGTSTAVRTSADGQRPTFNIQLLQHNSVEEVRRVAGEEERIVHPRRHQEDLNVEQPRKRQRRIMSDEQMALMEEALKDEPEMQRFPDRVQRMTNILNGMGPEISCNQLKNWINNRKAKLVKLAKEGRLGPIMASNTTAARVAPKVTVTRAAEEHQETNRPPVVRETEARSGVTQIGQNVVLINHRGMEVAFGVTKAVTPGEEGAVAMCLVEIQELKVDRNTPLPIGSDFMGTTFEEAEKKLGKLIVAWPSNSVQLRT